MTEYRAVSWGDDELLTAAKLNQMATNDKFLAEHAMPQLYRAYGLTKTDGLKIATGIVTILAQTAPEASFDVSFNGFFTQGTRPVVQLTAAILEPRRVWTTVKGIGPGDLRPDHTGFQIRVNYSPHVAVANHFPGNFHVHWMALGY